MFSLQWLSAVSVAGTLSLRNLQRPSHGTTAEAGVPPQCWESPPPSPLPTNTAYGPLEFGSVTARYPELTVSTSHPICHLHYAQGRSPPYPTGKAVPQSSWKCSEIDPAAGKTRRRSGLLWCLPIPKGIIRFLRHIGVRTLPDRQVWEEWVGTFYGSRKNRVSQPFWLLQHILLLYWWCFVSSHAYLSISWLKWIWKGLQTWGIVTCWPLTPTDSVFDMQIDFMGSNLNHFLYYDF